jgi:hypothetical protein
MSALIYFEFARCYFVAMKKHIHMKLYAINIIAIARAIRKVASIKLLTKQARRKKVNYKKIHICLSYFSV